MGSTVLSTNLIGQEEMECYFERKKIYQPKILYSPKFSSTNEGEIKT